MYTYQRAVGVSRRAPQGEELIDISNLACNKLFTEYSRLIIVVTDSLANRQVAIDLQNYYVELGTYSGKIQAWLNTKSTTVLVTSNTLPGDRYRFVTTHDMQYKGFSLKPGNAALGDNWQDSLTTADAPDIRVVKTDNTDVKFDEMVKRGLFTINGHLVRAVAGNRCVYLLNAGKHFNVHDNIHVNYLNFNTVSTLQTYPIAAADIDFKEVNGLPFLHVKSPVNMTGKTCLMSIGGRLYLNDVAAPTGDTTFAIKINKVDWFSAIFDSKELIDLSGVIDRERMVVPKNFFRTKEFFTNLLTDKSSFIIVLDNQYIDIQVKPMVSYLYPFTYHTEETKQLPILTGNGLLPKYFTRRIINRRLLDIDIGVQKLYVNKTVGTQNGGDLLHGFKSKYTPSRLHPGYLLYIRAIIQGT